MNRKQIRASIIGLALMWCGSARASMLFIGQVSGSGSGLGTNNVVLSIQNTPTEQGCVAWNGTVDVIGASACQTIPAPANTYTGGNEGVGGSQTQTRPLATLGVPNAFSMVVLLNPSEPSSGNSLTVQNLTLTIYDPTTGAVLFSSGNLSGGAFTLTSTDQAQGGIGFGFKLDPAQAVAANPFITCPTCSSNRVGLAAFFADSAGRSEVLSVASIATSTAAPEPYTILTLASGLGILFRLRRARAFLSSHHKYRQ